MPIADAELEATVRELSSKPGHEKVRALVHKLLTEALGASSEQIIYEHRLPEVRGRIDALLGRTVIEIKRDLDKEEADAKEQLSRYLPEREAATGQRYIGLATDGARFRAYEMREGELTPLTEHKAKPSAPRALAVWLEGVVAVQDRLPADALNIIAELGRQSTAYARANGLLRTAWEAVGRNPEPALKRQLWERHLRLVYGKAVEDDDLWLQHTYLVVIAKAIAAGAMGFDEVGAEALLSGEAFRQHGVIGAVESDFFDWVLDAPEGGSIVERLASHARRFDLADINIDLLKVLYESLIDPKQRHDLGEYYTPDWLAHKVVREAVTRPAEDRVLDPSCGSGSFLFHALRRKREALAAAGVAADAVAARCASAVFGFDIHPVAVIFARVTFLLGLGPALQQRRGDISIPVFLGDALQWNVRRDEMDLVVEVPPEPKAEKKGGKTLRFPLSICADAALFDRVVSRMHDASEGRQSAGQFASFMGRDGVPDEAVATLTETFRVYDALRRAGRDHIWGYVARNLSRPVALSDGGGVDVIVGNPPWLSYRFMSREMQAQFRKASKDLGVWVADDEARLVTQTDLSGYFFAHAAKLYLSAPQEGHEGGRIAMVLPLAAMTRGQFRRFRSGDWADVKLAFTAAWVLDNQDIVPLFRVPTCVLFARRTEGDAVRVPSRVTAFFGRLPFKDAPEGLADRHVRLFDAPAPTEVSFEATSPYRERFRQGATLVPRMLAFVQRVPAGRLGGSAAAPLVRSRRSVQEKQPWKGLESQQSPVEADFLKPVYLGESIAPFRVLEILEGIVPVSTGGDVLDSKQLASRGNTNSAKWMARAQASWKVHSAGTMTLKERWDFGGGLSAQFPVSAFRLVYSASGTQPAACVLRDANGVVEHGLYWAKVGSVAEGHFLATILNSELVRSRIAHMQSRGEQGERHFDKLFFTLPIPLFDARTPLHVRLAALGEEAERIAANVPLEHGLAFTTARGIIRAALKENGVSARIDALVGELLGDAGPEGAVPFQPPHIPHRERARMIRQVQEASLALRDDPGEQAMQDEIEALQEENAEALES